MSFDISHVLRDWNYTPGQISARLIKGDDDNDKIQLRLDLGLMQMETTGRPDGRKPHGFESLFKYYQNRLEIFKAEHGSDRGFCLDEKACEELRGESIMYYHRYLAHFVLEDYHAVISDTDRTLRLMDFVHAYAEETSDRYMLEQYRPYVLMMNTRSRAQQLLADQRPKQAFKVCTRGMEALRAFYKRFGRENEVDDSSEMAILKGLFKQIESVIPQDPQKKLQKELDQAVANEDYEHAAKIRDKLSGMKNHPHS